MNGVVLDVNVLVSSVIAPLGIPRRVFAAWRNGQRTEATLVSVPPEERRPITGDPEDDYVLATGRLARASYLVTGDHDLLAIKQYEGMAIVSPREFLEILGELSSVIGDSAQPWRGCDARHARPPARGLYPGTHPGRSLMAVEQIVEELVNCPRCGGNSYRCVLDEQLWHCESCKNIFSRSD